MKKLVIVLLALSVLLVWAQPLDAAITFVNSCTGRSTDASTFITGNCNFAGANFLVFAVASHEGIAATISDSSFNSWSCRTIYGPASTGTMKLCYAANAVTTSTHTITITCTGCFPSVAGSAFRTVLAVSPYDVENGATYTTATTVQPGSVTPGQNNELVVTGVSNGVVAGNTFIINSGFSTPVGEGASATNYGSRFAYLIQTVAAAVNPTWTANTADTGASSIASFKEAVSGSLLSMGVGR